MQKMNLLRTSVVINNFSKILPLIQNSGIHYRITKNYVHDTSDLFDFLKNANCDIHEYILDYSFVDHSVTECKNIIGESKKAVNDYKKEYACLSDDYYYKCVDELNKRMDKWLELIDNLKSEYDKDTYITSTNRKKIDLKYMLFREKIPDETFLFVNKEKYQLNSN
jgi:hypothetical protein